MKTIILTALFIYTSVNAFSAVRTWDGCGADANWQTAANWVGDVAPSANDDLFFPTAASQFTANNNFPLLTTFNSITIEGGTYTLSGNFIRLSNGLNVGAGAQTINIALTLAGAQTFSAASAAATATIV